jgi:ATP-dependent DNA ligase
LPAVAGTRPVDGWRILAYKDGARVRLTNRNGVDHARRFVQ